MRFNQYDQVVVAATGGQGMALGRGPLLKHMLQDGKLVAPFRDKSVAPRAYYVMASKTSSEEPDVKRFIDWVFEEAERKAR